MFYTHVCNIMVTLSPTGESCLHHCVVSISGWQQFQKMAPGNYGTQMVGPHYILHVKPLALGSVLREP